MQPDPAIRVWCVSTKQSGYPRLLLLSSPSLSQGIAYQSNQFDTALGEFWLQFGKGTEFGGAGGGEIVLEQMYHVSQTALPRG